MYNWGIGGKVTKLYLKYQGTPLGIIKTKTSEKADMQMKERGVRYTEKGVGGLGRRGTQGSDCS